MVAVERIAAVRLSPQGEKALHTDPYFSGVSPGHVYRVAGYDRRSQTVYVVNDRGNDQGLLLGDYEPVDVD